jgi:hypothetical protein
MIRLYTENVNKSKVIALARNYLDGFTVFYGTGYWEQTQEHSLVIDTTKSTRKAANALAQAICVENGQESVLVEEYVTDYSAFVTRHQGEYSAPDVINPRLKQEEAAPSKPDPIPEPEGVYSPAKWRAAVDAYERPGVVDVPRRYADAVDYDGDGDWGV